MRLQGCVLRGIYLNYNKNKTVHLYISNESNNSVTAYEVLTEKSAWLLMLLLLVISRTYVSNEIWINRNKRRILCHRIVTYMFAKLIIS